MVETGSRWEQPREIDDSALKLKGRVEGHCPVEAEGSVENYQFYFHARGTSWSWVVSLSAEVDPSSLTSRSGRGFFSDKANRGFLLEGDYGTSIEASWMPYAKAEEIIRDCTIQFIEALKIEGITTKS